MDHLVMKGARKAAGPAKEWLNSTELLTYKGDFARHFRLKDTSAIGTTVHAFPWQAILDQQAREPGRVLHGLYFTYGLERGNFVPVVELVLRTNVAPGYEILSGNAWIHSETGSTAVDEPARLTLVGDYLAGVEVQRLSATAHTDLTARGVTPDPCGFWYPMAGKIDRILSSPLDPTELLVVSCISAEVQYAELERLTPPVQDSEYRHFLALSMGRRNAQGELELRSLGADRIAATAMDVGNACPPNCPPRRP